LFFALAHDWIQGIHGKWFHLSKDQFDAIHYAGMAIFKIGIILLTWSPLSFYVSSAKMLFLPT
jgi:hypothetical protein